MRSSNWKEPITETVNVTEARRGWSDLLNRVFRREARIIVEKSGIPVAAIISGRDLERLQRWEAQRTERFAALDESQAAFRDVPDEELERELNRAVTAVRRAGRQPASKLG